MFSISIFVTFVDVPDLRTSSSGASAVTVIDSATAGFSVMVTSELRPTLTLMPARVDMPYPASSAFSV